MKGIALLCVVLLAFGGKVAAVSNTFLDYQNYNHGYCPECSCAPCKCGANPTADPYTDPEAECNSCQKPNACNPAPVTGCQCGLSNTVLGLLVAGIAAGAAILISTGYSHSHSHSHN